MKDININDKFDFYSEIFNDFNKVNKSQEEKTVYFVSTEKWLEQLGRRFIS